MANARQPDESQYRRSLNESTRRDRQDTDSVVPDTEGLEQLDQQQGGGDTGGYTNILSDDEPISQRLRPASSQKRQRPSGPSGGAPKSESEYERAAREDWQRQQESEDEDRERQAEAAGQDRERQEAQPGGKQETGGWGWQTRADGKRYWVKTPERDRERRLLDKNATVAEKARYYREQAAQSIAQWKNRLSADYWKNKAALAVKNRIKSLVINILWNNPWVRTATLAVIGAILGIAMIWFISIMAVAAVCTWTDEHDIPVVTPIVRQVVEWQTQIECPKNAKSPAATGATGTSQ